MKLRDAGIALVIALFVSCAGYAIRSCPISNGRGSYQVGARIS